MSYMKNIAFLPKDFYQHNKYACFHFYNFPMSANLVIKAD